MARLPQPGADDGVWGDLLNSFLQVEHNADGTLKTSGSLGEKLSVGTVTTKGDLLAATGNATIARLGVGTDGQILTADATQTSGIRWATRPSGYHGYNVKDYGAIGNNTADDTSAIQAALNAASNDGGGIVFIPAGTYKISSALTLPTSVSIAGAGMNSAILRQTSSTANVLNSADNYRFASIRDIQILGPSSGSGVGIYLGFSATTPADISLQNIFIKNMGSHGIYMNTPIATVLVNIRAQGCGEHGFYIVSGTSVTFEACYANANVGNGYQMDSVNYSAFNACASDNNTIGYAINGSSAIVLNGCGSEQCGIGFKILGGSGNVDLLCCKVLAETGIGFWVTGNSSFCFLIGLREASPNGATASVQVDSGSTATVINPQTTTAVNYAAGSVNLFQSTNLEVHSSGSSVARVSRGATTNTSRFTLQTSNSDRWSMQLTNDSTDNWHLTDLQHTTDAIVATSQTIQPNLGLLTGAGTASYGNGVGVAFLANASTKPTSNPTNGGVLYSNTGTLQWRDPNGNVASLMPNSLMPNGASAETCPRAVVTGTSSASLTSGTVYARAILLPAGTAINTLTLFTAAGNVATQANLTHGWYALLDNTLTVRAVSSDQITTSFLTTANTGYSLSVASSAYVTTYTGLYYIAVSVSVSAGNMPQFAVSGSIGTGVGSVSPILQGTAGTQAAPPATGAQLAGGTVTFSNSNAFYSYTS